MRLELIDDSTSLCEGCMVTMDLAVLTSAAGHYVGYYCPNCGPSSRLSVFYDAFEEAEEALDTANFHL